MSEFKLLRDDKYGISPSAIGDLFGVGFNSPIDRFRMDIGEIGAEFTEEERHRIELGKILENSVLDYFEYYYGIEITDRNIDLKYAEGGTTRYIVDGKTVFNGVPTGVECKVSNSQYGSFYDNQGYLLQVQAYMEFEDYDQWFLLGLQNGKPISRLIRRDRKIGRLIREMNDFYSQALLGLKDFVKDFPEHLVKEYNNSVEIEKVEEITEVEHSEILELMEIKEKIKELKDRETEITDRLKKAYLNKEIVTQDYKLTVSERTRKGGFDFDKLALEHPEINLDDYYKEPSTYSTVNLRKIK